MQSQIRVPRLLIGLALGASAVAFAACNGTGGAPTGGAPSIGVTPTTAASVEPSMAATAGPSVAAISIDKLPEASFDPSKAAIACDDATIGTTGMSCAEIVAATARVSPLESNQPIQQIAVSQSTDTAGALKVTFWVLPDEGSSGLSAFTFTIDPAAKTFTFPTADAAAVFPTAS